MDFKRFKRDMEMIREYMVFSTKLSDLLNAVPETPSGWLVDYFIDLWEFELGIEGILGDFIFAFDFGETPMLLTIDDNEEIKLDSLESFWTNYLGLEI